MTTSLSLGSSLQNYSWRTTQRPREIRIHMETMATRKRCKLSSMGPDFENVIKRLLCVRTLHTRIGGDLTPGIINRRTLANAEQMGLQGSTKHFSVLPSDLWTLDDRGWFL
ncbi:LOW QUALITY PROTEIN: AP20 region protein 1 [Sus scrofa]|uniref:LOW QUALITY PROTEIN: AP20 region protein 1 n=1 Tax=Sus scrofa TaxID=9823 RepID=UPI0003AE87C2|nr:LOW QUALITY PROTEIN: AP20 region protein 1 [Sus scrofa]